ncbi:hypothetical protein HMPREF9098_1368 [Kingella denitrificans ATCC 33394]|uniref:Uncharacterized protein n=1 Tax=Kingella denitrificans ATCC 33394 TaxID=888741 RepID=F0EZN1_9NEIS|nr:hypothetical protein HMPREF9098_1368 [Kingella denitrificans ATCC 33394]
MHFASILLAEFFDLTCFYNKPLEALPQVVDISTVQSSLHAVFSKCRLLFLRFKSSLHPPYRPIIGRD